MAITRHIAKLLLAEYSFRPFGPEILLLGRQAVFLTPDQAQDLVISSGLSLNRNANINYSTTLNAPKNTLISDRSFFNLFCDSNVLACDISDYEGADIIFDLSDSVPKSCISRFDFVYNGSVLDNCFSASNALINCTTMLKKGGVAFHTEGMNHLGDAYLKMTPDWFFDYFAVNEFDDFQGFVCTYNHVHESNWQVYDWAPFYKIGDRISTTPPLDIRNHASVVAIATKGSLSTNDRIPVQAPYRQDHSKYVALAIRSRSSNRLSSYQAAFRQVRFPGHSLLGDL